MPQIGPYAALVVWRTGWVLDQLRQRRQLTAPGWEPAETSLFSPAKAARTSPFSRSGTLKSSRVLASSAEKSPNTSGEILPAAGLP